MKEWKTNPGPGKETHRKQNLESDEEANGLQERDRLSETAAEVRGDSIRECCFDPLLPASPANISPVSRVEAARDGVHM